MIAYLGVKDSVLALPLQCGVMGALWENRQSRRASALLELYILVKYTDRAALLPVPITMAALISHSFI